MDEKVEKSCWGVTAWAVAGFACIITVVYLMGINNAAEVAAALPH